MTEVAVVFHSSTGTTKRMAEAVHAGVLRVPEVRGALHEIRAADIADGRWKNDALLTRLDAAEAMSQFTDVSVGQDLYNVIENVTAGTTYSNVGTSDTATAPSVTTLGADRRRILLLSVNDDNATSVFTSPGNWSIGHSYAEASGTDGKVELQHRSIPTATTVNPGTCTVTDSDAWGVVGFALRNRSRPIPGRSTRHTRSRTRRSPTRVAAATLTCSWMTTPPIRTGCCGRTSPPVPGEPN